MPKMTNFKDLHHHGRLIIAKFGGSKALHELTKNEHDWAYQTINRWAHKGIPPAHWLSIIEIGKRHKLKLEWADFVGEVAHV